MHPILLGVSWTKETKGANWKLVHTQFYHDNKFTFDILYPLLLDIAVTVIIFLILVVMTLMTIIKLKEAMSWRQSSAAVTRNIGRHQTALTVMLLLVSLVHIVTIIPFVAWHVVYFLLPDPFITYYTAFMTFRGVTNSFPAVNSLINIFIYYFRSSRFRVVFRNMFCHSRNQSHVQATYIRKVGA